MWRVRHRDGTLSDMANISWAKDGAAATVRILNTQETRLGSPRTAIPLKIGRHRRGMLPRNVYLLVAAWVLAGSDVPVERECHGQC
jgi:hypothetical protein